MSSVAVGRCSVKDWTSSIGLGRVALASLTPRDLGLDCFVTVERIPRDSSEVSPVPWHFSRTRTSLFRVVVPRVIESEDLGTPISSASKPNTARFALPLSGAALIQPRNTSLPSPTDAGRRRLAEALVVTRAGTTNGPARDSVRRPVRSPLRTDQPEYARRPIWLRQGPSGESTAFVGVDSAYESSLPASLSHACLAVIRTVLLSLSSLGKIAAAASALATLARPIIPAHCKCSSSRPSISM